MAPTGINSVVVHIEGLEGAAQSGLHLRVRIVDATLVDQDPVEISRVTISD